jgi:hypothetical protein
MESNLYRQLTKIIRKEESDVMKTAIVGGSADSPK